MNWFHHHFPHPTQFAIARTGFFVSLISYVIFWAMDIIRPGFVSRFFSVHLFLLAALLFAVWLLLIGDKSD